MGVKMMMVMCVCTLECICACMSMTVIINVAFFGAGTDRGVQNWKRVCESKC